MTFDEVLLPLQVGYGSSGGPNFSTDIVVIDSGFERRNQNWAQPRRVYDARTGLRSQKDAAELLSFFCARAGRARGFRLRDWSDFSSASDHISAQTSGDQVIGTGDAQTTKFQLRKTYSSGGVSHTRTIAKPIENSVQISVDGTTLADGWVVDPKTGIVTFAMPPATGKTVTAGYLFDVPVRFDVDRLPLCVETYATYHTEIPLVEIRIS